MEIKQLIVGELLTNCYLIFSNSEILIIDPGAEDNRILEEINKLEGKVKYIINTHHHFDHTTANEGLKKETLADILIHEEEKTFMKFEADRFLKEGDEIKIGDSVLQILHTPGHTKGSICLLSDRVAFTGDTLFKDGYGRTDLPGGSSEEMEKSLKKLSEILKPGTMVYPGHGKIFKV